MKERMAALALFGAAVLVLSGQPAFAQANKVVASGDKIVVIAPQASVPLMSATMKTSKPTDVMLAVSLECTILTDVITSNEELTATAQGEVRVWVEVDGQIVPINSMSSPPQLTPPGGDDTDKVTFCHRVHTRTVTDDENPLDGVDRTDDYIRTKEASAFNWLRLNLGSGNHSIVVKGTLTTNATGSSSAAAEVGNRTLIAEPTKMAVDASF
jgi:hypothetical protein